ncbi:MAG: hypothetical protein SPF67_01190 [Eubacteriales bacterium]|nr:hypothetical protein [Eubacterium sp.]MDY5493159.1 hypothetical protein [Eubacteriales bacterium]
MGNNLKFAQYNNILFKKLSVFINHEADFIRPEFIESLCRDCDISKEEAYCFTLAASIDLDTEKNPRDAEIFEEYFPDMVHLLKNKDYENNPYLKNIKIPTKKLGKWELCYKTYVPYQAFVFDDPKITRDGKIIPQIGFFEKEFSYPAVLESGTEWMLITPNEINTMRAPISGAHGKVLTYGLGLGYFAYMVSEKESVSSVTIVERDKNAISLFRDIILPQMPRKDKINIICDDAFYFAETRLADSDFDFVFADIWHDPSDGVPAYNRLKATEKYLPSADFSYWIEKTLKCYI